MACVRPRTSPSPHVPMSAAWKPHLCDLQGTSAAPTPSITSDMTSGWGWSSLRLLPPPPGSPRSCSHGQGGNGPEPREADVGRGGRAPGSPQIPTWLQYRRPSPSTRSLPGDWDRELTGQRNARGPSKSHSDRAACVPGFDFSSRPGGKGEKSKN